MSLKFILSHRNLGRERYALGVSEPLRKRLLGSPSLRCSLFFLMNLACSDFSNTDADLDVLPCSSDAPCTGNRICQLGECVAPEIPFESEVHIVVVPPEGSDHLEEHFPNVDLSAGEAFTIEMHDVESFLIDVVDVEDNQGDMDIRFTPDERVPGLGYAFKAHRSEQGQRTLLRVPRHLTGTCRIAPLEQSGAPWLAENCISLLRANTVAGSGEAFSFLEAPSEEVFSFNGRLWATRELSGESVELGVPDREVYLERSGRRISSIASTDDYGNFNLDVYYQSEDRFASLKVLSQKGSDDTQSDFPNLSFDTNFDGNVESPESTDFHMGVWQDAGVLWLDIFDAEGGALVQTRTFVERIEEESSASVQEEWTQMGQSMEQGSLRFDLPQGDYRVWGRGEMNSENQGLHYEEIRIGSTPIELDLYLGQRVQRSLTIVDNQGHRIEASLQIRDAVTNVASENSENQNPFYDEIGFQVGSESTQAYLDPGHYSLLVTPFESQLPRFELGLYVDADVEQGEVAINVPEARSLQTNLTNEDAEALAGYTVRVYRSRGQNLVLLGEGVSNELGNVAITLPDLSNAL